MFKKETIMVNIENEVKPSKINYYDSELFYNDAIRYIKAIKQCRMICNIDSVSKSGMSRTLKFISCEKDNYEKQRFYYSNYYSFFKALGYQSIKNSHYFRVYGCGMDMVFDTNHTIIHKLKKLGFLSKKECDILCQKTPDIV